jgi:hypothetical protein
VADVEFVEAEMWAARVVVEVGAVEPLGSDIAAVVVELEVEAEVESDSAAVKAEVRSAVDDAVESLGSYIAAAVVELVVGVDSAVVKAVVRPVVKDTIETDAELVWPESHIAAAVVVNAGFAVAIAAVGVVVWVVVRDSIGGGVDADAAESPESHIAAAAADGRGVAAAEATEEEASVLAEAAVVSAVHMRGHKTAPRVEDRQRNSYSSRIGR